MLALRKSREDSIHSQTYIKEALSALLHEHKLQDITVTAICKKAGVARVTFYKYYRNVYDVVQASVDEIVQHFLKEVDSLDPYESMQLIIEYIIEGFVSAQKPSGKLIDANISSMMLDYLNYTMEKVFQADITRNHDMSRMQILFLAGGIYNIVNDWLKRGAKESPQVLAAKIYEILPYGTTDTRNSANS
nr:TetR/AcrR family transcriptional regulator [Bacillus cereus]